MWGILDNCMSALMLVGWAVCWALGLGETREIEPSDTETEGCVSKGDDHDLTVMESKG